MSEVMQKNDPEDRQEAQIPERAHVALRQARRAALRNGATVLVARQNTLVELAPDGTSHILRVLAASVPVVRGQKILRRSS